MNLGIIVGAIAFVIGLVALIGAVALKFSSRGRPTNFLPYIFYAGIPILLLASIAGFWECYSTGQWSDSLMPFGLLFMALTAIHECKRIVNHTSGSTRQIGSSNQDLEDPSGR
jgi:hypothetical protein